MGALASITYDGVTVARRELARVFQGRRGLFLAAGLMALAALPAGWRALAGAGPNAAAFQHAQILAMAQVFPRDVVRYLMDCPPPLAVGIIATLFFQPAYILLAGSEMLAGEVESGMIRFSIGRASRTGLLLGKALGLWAVIALLTLLVHVIICLTSALGPAGDSAGVWRWGPRLYLVACAAATVPCSIVVLLGAIASRPRRVIVSGVTLLLVLRIGRVALANRGLRVASYLPGGLDDRLLSPVRLVSAGGAALLLAWSALLLGVATLVFKRRSL
jgi:hypothetical protein